MRCIIQSGCAHEWGREGDASSKYKEELEITAGHWPISGHFAYLANQTHFGWTFSSYKTA